MRVAFEAQRILRSTRYGMDIVAQELLNELAAIGVEITLFAANGPNFINLPKISIFNGGPKIYPLWEQLYLPLKLDSKFDIAHYSANTAPLKQRIPSVLTLHDVIFLDPNYAKRGGSLYQQFGSKYRQFVVNRIIHSCNRIVTVSNYEKKHITELTDIDPKRVEVIYNGVSKHFSEAVSKENLKECRKQFDLPENFILFFGNRDGKKNSKKVIQSFLEWRRMSASKCSLVITNLTKEYYQQILREIDKKDDYNSIKLIPFVNHPMLPALYSLASVYLYPSIAESFGLSILESMACGTPVITSNITAMPEIGGEAAHYVDPKSIISIMDGIEQVYNNKDMQKDMAAKGLTRAQKYTWHSAAKQYQALYSTIQNEQ